MKITRTVKGVLALLAVAAMLAFSQVNPGILLASILGAGLVMIGLASYYRPASVAGLVIAAGSAAISNNPGSLAEVPSWLNAVLGLLVPTYVLAWVALTSGAEESYELMIRSKASAYTVMFMLACLLSVPVASLVVGALYPSFSVAMSPMAEIAIMLLVATVGVILLTSQAPLRPTEAEQLTDEQGD